MSESTSHSYFNLNILQLFFSSAEPEVIEDIEEAVRPGSRRHLIPSERYVKLIADFPLT